MRITLFVLAVVLCSVAGTEPEKPIQDQIQSTVDNIKGKVKSDAQKTAKDIKNKSKEFSDKIQSQSDSFVDTVFGFVKSVISSIGDFFKILFGDNSPAQPALADPAVAGMAQSQTAASRSGTKALVITLLGALGYLAWTAVGQYKPKTEAPVSYYRNLEENFL